MWDVFAESVPNQEETSLVPGLLSARAAHSGTLLPKASLNDQGDVAWRVAGLLSARAAHRIEQMTHANNRSPGFPWTVPNILCLVRLVGSGVLVVIAWAGWHWIAFGLVLVLLATDWLDGKIAVRFDLRSSLGAKLDTIADTTLYSCVVLTLLLLRPSVIQDNAAWIAATGVSYVLAVVVSFVKFRRWPSYHAYSAKLTWAAAATAIVLAFLDVADWPVRVAAALATLGNLESVAITLALRRHEVDVPSILHALLLRRGQEKAIKR
jgi:CDP-diacylglycerol--glycerol-3-phosphate 3-phosphatidyltransferase